MYTSLVSVTKQPPEVSNEAVAGAALHASLGGCTIDMLPSNILFSRAIPSLHLVSHFFPFELLWIITNHYKNEIFSFPNDNG